jgi:quercetin dioxygenase-like cupin family protein
MHRRHARQFVTVLIAAIGATGASCTPAKPPQVSATVEDAPPRTGFVLQIEEGERRVRRTAGKGPFVLKVDRVNGDSPELVMGYEDIAPGGEIQLHRHLVADEIIFVHKGSGVVSLDGRESALRPGSTIYIPREVTVGLVNTGAEPLGIAFVFSRPGFEELMRDNSVREGEPVVPLTPEERAAIQARHRWHTIAGPRPVKRESLN